MFFCYSIYFYSYYVVYVQIYFSIVNDIIYKNSDRCYTYHHSVCLLQLVLQISKVRNASAPKANQDSQAAPRMLKLTLTDGHSFCQGVELSTISSISCDRTPPGSKVLIKNAKLKSGYLHLQPNNCTFLGGRVPALFEKWEISRNILKNPRLPCKYVLK